MICLICVMYDVCVLCIMYVHVYMWDINVYIYMCDADDLHFVFGVCCCVMFVMI